MSVTVESRVMVGARAVSLGYGAQPVLREVNIEMGAGEFWFLLGNNGQGKSTFVHALLGLMRPLAGEMVRTARAAVDRTGFVPQRCEWSAALSTTVREFVRLGLVGLRLSAADADGRVVQALQQVGLVDAGRRRYGELSGGQRQRALVARALARRPSLLILDEPTNALDYAVEASLLELLAACQRSDGMTVVLVSHDVPMAARCATHVALFAGGTVRAGPRDEVLTPESVLATFGTAIPGVFG